MSTDFVWMTQLKVDDKVDIFDTKYKGKRWGIWHTGKIKEIRDAKSVQETLLISFDGWSHQFDKITTYIRYQEQ